MKFSLLFPNVSHINVGNIGSKTLYHLSLDKSFAAICQSKSECQYFLETLSKPLRSPKDILFRQQIIADFLQFPAFLGELKTSLNQFTKLKQDFKNLKKEIHARNFGIGSAIGGSRESVRDCSRLLKKVLYYTKDFSQLLGKYPTSSKGFESILNDTISLVQKEDFTRLIARLEETENVSLESNTVFSIKLDKNGKIADCHLIDSQDLSSQIPKEKKRLLTRKESLLNSSYLRLDIPSYSDCQTKLGAYPYMEMENLLLSLIAGVLDTFGDIQKEIVFYSVAVEYVRWLAGKKISFTFPTVGDNTQFVGMTDVYLATTNQTDTIVTNDFYMSKGKKGSIIFGDNGNGKTVFLRSISVCQILAQAGMPIPAASGTIELFSTLKTQFSESEDTTSSNEKMGRFEQEVSELCELIDTSESASLLILNEIFQTTAYAEGAIGLYHILNYLSAKNIGWILVSHLTDLNQYFENQDVSIYKMTKEHKVIQIQ
ncbi:MAG: hypothetical protein E7584_00150 [Ruminococcaceae bacterium]|nr:hypothetical protein [Oscillospiraceae bacterium]